MDAGIIGNEILHSGYQDLKEKSNEIPRKFDDKEIKKHGKSFKFLSQDTLVKFGEHSTKLIDRMISFTNNHTKEELYDLLKASSEDLSTINNEIEDLSTINNEIEDLSTINNEINSDNKTLARYSILLSLINNCQCIGQITGVVRLVNGDTPQQKEIEILNEDQKNALNNSIAKKLKDVIQNELDNINLNDEQILSNQKDWLIQGLNKQTKKMDNLIKLKNQLNSLINDPSFNETFHKNKSIFDKYRESFTKTFTDRLIDESKMLQELLEFNLDDTPSKIHQILSREESQAICDFINLCQTALHNIKSLEDDDKRRIDGRVMPERFTDHINNSIIKLPEYSEKDPYPLPSYNESLGLTDTETSAIPAPAGENVNHKTSQHAGFLPDDNA